MLVLSRKAGERILIGADVELTVLGVQQGRVKLGFAGPREVPIHRDELVQGHAQAPSSPGRLPSSRCLGNGG
jgi:carbon storage regulator